jgi:hypothetical protein
MSRGLGWVQRSIVNFLNENPRLTTAKLTSAVYAVETPTHCQCVAVRRSLNNLVRTGVIKRRLKPKAQLAKLTERLAHLPVTTRLQLLRVSLAEANAFVGQHHRHHKAVIGHIFSLGCVKDGALVGVVIVGRPVSRRRDDGLTAEVTRLCTDGTRNACSFLYGAAARGAFALGFFRVGTYILSSETGQSLKASGWKLVGEAGGGSWDCVTRRRVDKHPTGKKRLFEIIRA